MSLFARQKMANDPYYRFGSLAELPIAAELGIKIDVNSATIDDWLRLPGLSIHQARALVALQQAGLELYSIEDLAAALGMPGDGNAIPSRFAALQKFGPALFGISLREPEQ